MSLLLAVSLGFSSPSGFSSGLPLLLPIFGIVGSMGGLMVFTNDRLKGVLEYLLAYGVPSRRLFLNVILASLALLSIVLAVSLTAAVSLQLVRGRTPTSVFWLLLVLYTLPMSYASAAFASTVGMFWTSLSSPRTAMNSPIGLAPLIGIVPSLAALGAVIALGVGGSSSPSTFLLVSGTALAVVVVVVIVLLTMTGRLLRSERLLSPT